MDINTSNDFFFGSNGREVIPMLPVIIRTKEQAYRTAAYIEMMGMMLPSEDEGSVEYSDVREAVWNT